MDAYQLLLPTELKKMVRRKILFRLLSCLLLMALILFVIIKWGDNWLSNSTFEIPLSFKYSCFAIFLLLPILN